MTIRLRQLAAGVCCVLLLCAVARAGILFDGVDDGVDANSGTTLMNYTTTGFTASCWALFATAKSADLVSRDGVSTGWNLACNTAPRINAFTRGTGDAQTTSDTALSFSEWHHVAMTYSGTSGSREIFVDGESDVTPESYSGSIASSTLDVWIGNRPDEGGTREFSGQIEDVRVYSRVLSAAEIATLYTHGRRRANKRIGGALAQDLDGHWEMHDRAIGTDSAGGANVMDTSGNNNHGTPVDGADGSMVYTEPANN